MQSVTSFLFGAAIMLLTLALIRYLRKSLRDTTSHKEMDEFGYSQMACLHAGDGLLILSMDGLIRWVNPAYCRLMGYQAEEMIEKKPWHLRPCPKNAGTKRLWKGSALMSIWKTSQNGKSAKTCAKMAQYSGSKSACHCIGNPMEHVIRCWSVAM